jgi:hypothetical protein
MPANLEGHPPNTTKRGLPCTDVATFLTPGAAFDALACRSESSHL